jgi:peptide/nickel transport system permease protein
VLNFLIRRILAGIATLVVALFLMYLLVDRAIDPLQDLLESNVRNKQQLIDARIDLLNLDTNVVVRFFQWAGNLLTGDFGIAWRSGQPVRDLLTHAIGSTLQLVTAATILSLVIGVTVGIVSALRQYSGFDYGIIFLSFLLYSLPSFWVAVLLKQWAAIGFNDFLKDPVIGWSVIAGIALVAGLFWSLAVGGRPARRWQVFGIAFAATFAMFAYLQLSGWWERPQIGPILLLILAGGSAVAIAAVFAGVHNRRAMWTALTTVGVGLALYFPMQVVFDSITVNNWIIFVFALVAIGIGFLIGRLYGGPDCGISARTGADYSQTAQVVKAGKAVTVTSTTASLVR